MPKKIPISIIGGGCVGQTLGYLLHHSSKYVVTTVAATNMTSARKATRFIGRGVKPSTDIFETARRGKIVFITTPDDTISNIFKYLVRHNGFPQKTLVIHCSGSFSSDIFRYPQVLSRILQTGSFHPLQTFATPQEAVRNFNDVICTYESDSPEARSQIVSLIKTIGGVPVRIRKPDKPLYHTAGVMASNYLVTLLYLARQFLREIGFTPHLAQKAILPLVEGTLTNIRKVGFPDALTGPISRGDIKTIKRHLEIIKLHLPRYLKLYKLLGRYTIPLAVSKGTLVRSKTRMLERLLS